MSEPSRDIHASHDLLSVARGLLAEALARSADTLPDDASLTSTPGWDSLAHVRLVLAVEAHRGQPLAPEQVLQLTSLASIARVLAAPPPDAER